MTKNSEEKVQQLQLMEQNLQTLLLQRQKFQSQLLEAENALNELKATKKEVFKIIGTIMVESDKEVLIQDLESQKEILDLRIKNIEKQESLIKEQESKLQSDIMREMKK